MCLLHRKSHFRNKHISLQKHCATLKSRNKIYDFVFKDITVTPVIVFRGAYAWKEQGHIYTSQTEN